MKEDKILVEVNHLKQYFDINMGLFKTKPLKAVDDISFTIKKGETLGLVGESGCGKTTAGRSILHLYKPTSGEVIYDGKKVDKSTMQEYRTKATMVFQDPYSSLNPRMTVEDIIAEGLDIHREDIPMSSAVDRDRESELQGLWLSIRNSSSAMSLFPPWTYQSRPRSSICLTSFRISWALPISSLPMTFWL